MENDSFCDNQPVIQNTAIQDFGLLFVLDFDFKILQLSANVEASLGVGCAQVLGKKITDFLEDEDSRILLDEMKHGNLRNLNGFDLKLKTSEGFKHFSASFVIHSGYFILEAEFSEDKSDSRSALIARNRIAKLSLSLKESRSLQELCDRTAAVLKSILDMDKVMIYRFDESWHGTVVAEFKESAMEAYLGLKFPATDIPEPARNLYLINPVRMIPDITAPSVLIQPPLNPMTGDLADLKPCILRGVPSVHLEYLKNMKIVSSISVAIIHQGVLWGLIAFHHCSSKTLSTPIRSALEILSDSFSSHLSFLEEAQSYEAKMEIENFRKLAAAALMEQVTPADVFLREIGKISGLIHAGGAACFMDGQWFEWGVVPARSEIERLANWLQNNNFPPVYSTHGLADEFPGAEAIKDTASGLLAISVLGAFAEMVLWFRPEEIQTVKWGGDPSQTIQFSPDQKSYHPRQSFQVWKETVQLKSAFWSASDKAAVGQVRQILADALLNFRSARLKTISGILPICASCKKIRDEQNSWRVMEEYIQKRSKAKFSHSLCPDCYRRSLKEAGLEEH